MCVFHLIALYICFNQSDKLGNLSSIPGLALRRSSRTLGISVSFFQRTASAISNFCASRFTGCTLFSIHLRVAFQLVNSKSIVSGHRASWVLWGTMIKAAATSCLPSAVQQSAAAAGSKLATKIAIPILRLISGSYSS